MTTPANVDDLLAVYEQRGDEHYGEEVSQLVHALQCAAIARAEGATDVMVAAALLHDVGHLLVPAEPSAGGTDDRHEAVGARVLAAILGPAVAAPVALHVTAKRWRCATDPDYEAALSTASRASYWAQGGPLGDEARARFEAHPQFDAALALRAWDDAAKDPTVRAGALRDYEPLLRALAASSA